MTDIRRTLPARRPNVTFNVKTGNIGMTASVGFYPDGTVGELFVSSHKVGSDTEAIARDAAVLLSLAIQHGMPIDTIRHALTRNPDGTASSIIGILIDHIDGLTRSMATAPAPELTAEPV